MLVTINISNIHMFFLQKCSIWGKDILSVKYLLLVELVSRDRLDENFEYPSVHSCRLTCLAWEVIAWTNFTLLLMEEILHQVRLVVYSIIYYLQGFLHLMWLFGNSSINSIMPDSRIQKNTPFKKQHGPLQKWWCVEFGISLYIGGIPGPLTAESEGL